MKKYAVIVAGGSGERMKAAVPKQFMLINGKPILYYTIHAFLEAYTEIEIILVLPEGHIAKGQEIIDGYFQLGNIHVVAGGKTRFHSVQKGLGFVKVESIVFVHDGVRCFTSPPLIHRCYEAAVEHGTAIPAVPSKDSIRFVIGDTNKPVNRKDVMLIQTPQTFHSRILLPAYKIDYKDKFTDDATVVEAYGLKVHLVPGDESNIKITTPFDFSLAQQLAKQ